MPTQYASIVTDNFLYKTKLTFGSKLSKAIIEQVHRDVTVFTNYTSLYNDTGSNKTMSDSHPVNLIKTIRKFGKEKGKEILHRQAQIKKYFPEESLIEFNQYYCSTDWNSEAWEEIPEWIKENDPKIRVQVSQCDGKTGTLPPHIDYSRTSSLFMLLEGGGQETKWWLPTEPFETFPDMLIPDLDKLRVAFTDTIELGVWYVFNHAEWHSVHKFVLMGPSRIAFGLEFSNLPASDLVALCKKYGG